MTNILLAVFHPYLYVLILIVNLKRKKTEEKSSDSDDQDEKVEQDNKMKTTTKDFQPQQPVKDHNTDELPCNSSVSALSRPSSSKGRFLVGIGIE